MKKLFSFILLLSVLIVNAQTADEIVQKHTAAMGGLEGFKNVKSAKLSGSLLIQGNEFPITIQIVNGSGYRLDADMMGSTVIQSFHNGTGWKINPFSGAATATDLTGTELLDTKTQASLATQLMDYKARGHQLELLGKDTIEGVPAYKLKLTSKDDGRITFYAIDVSSYYVLKISSNRQIQGKDMMVDSYYSNWKDFDGLKFSMTRIQKLDEQVLQELDLEKVELNVPVDEKIFDKP